MNEANASPHNLFLDLFETPKDVVFLKQTAQTFLLMKEPLPENLQKLVEEQEKAEKRAANRKEELPFERKRKKKDKPT